MEMSSAYEKLIDTSHNPPSTYHQSQRSGTENGPELTEKQVQRKQKKEREPDYFEKTGNEQIFTRSDQGLSNSDISFKTKSTNISRKEKVSEMGKLSVDTFGMADTLNEGEKEKEFTKLNMGAPQDRRRVDSDMM